MDVKDEESTLADEVRAAFTESEKGGEEETEKKEQPRAEDGKFAAKEGETEVEAAARLEPAAKDKQVSDKKDPEPADVAAGVEAGERVLTEDKAPRGWSPASREKWATIPEDLRQEILRREEASVVGVRQLQERFAPMEGFVQQISPVFEEARAAGTNPAQYIHALAATEKVLRTADVPTKFQEILRLADVYGIPLRDVINESVGSKVLPAANHQQQQIPPQIQQELMEMRQWRQQFEGSNINNQISTFSQGKEFFEDVRHTMAGLVESGAAKSLEEAYDSACWSTPAVRQVLLSRQGKDKQTEDLKQKQTAAAGASAKPAGALDVKDDDDKDDDLAATVRKSFSAAASGRV